MVDLEVHAAYRDWDILLPMVQAESRQVDGLSVG